MGVMDEVCITISKGDVLVFPLELFCRLFVQVVDIGERPITCFPDIAVLVSPQRNEVYRRSSRSRLGTPLLIYHFPVLASYH